MLPYEVESIGVKVLNRIEPGEALRYEINILAQGEYVGTHVFRVEVYGPDGAYHPEHSKNVLAENGFFSGEMPIAINDADGEWKIFIRDVATGIVGEGRFIVTRDSVRENL